MRIIVACIIVLVTALAAVLLTRIDLSNPPTSVAANVPAPKPAIAPKPAPPADPVSTVANVELVSASMGSVTSAPASPESTPAATPPPSVVAAESAAPTAAPESRRPETGVSAAAASPPASQPVPCPGNPDALGISRTVQIDTTGSPGFGFEHFKQHDFLKPGEVVLTFDDGPWPGNTPPVLAALAHHCLKATFFPIGKHITYHPEILRQVAAAGHTIGSHTWSPRRPQPAQAHQRWRSPGAAGRRDAVADAEPFFAATRKFKIHPQDAAKLHIAGVVVPASCPTIADLALAQGKCNTLAVRFPVTQRRPPSVVDCAAPREAKRKGWGCQS